jgi:hypothetical protein
MERSLPGELSTGTYPTGASSLSQLAQFFSDVTPLRFPVQLTALLTGGRILKENVVIEFGTHREVLFASALPLEFDDRVRIENADGSLSAEAQVVAVRYDEGRRAVAARFSSKVANWIIQR